MKGIGKNKDYATVEGKKAETRNKHKGVWWGGIGKQPE